MNENDVKLKIEAKNTEDIASMSKMQNIKNDSYAQYIKNLEIVINWLQSNGKVYVGNRYSKPETNELGNIYIPQKMFEKYTEKELSLIIRHEAYHATTHFSKSMIKLASKQLKDYDVSLWDKLWYGKDFDNFSEKTENQVKKSEEISNASKEIDADESVIRFFYKNKTIREKYCSLVSSLSDNKQRIENCKVTNELIDNYFFTRCYNELVINIGAITNINNKIILLRINSSSDLRKKEEKLINFNKVKKRQQRMKDLLSTKQTTKYKYFLKKKIYYMFYNIFIFGTFDNELKKIPSVYKELRQTRQKLLEEG